MNLNHIFDNDDDTENVSGAALCIKAQNDNLERMYLDSDEYCERMKIISIMDDNSRTLREYLENE